MGIFRLGYVEVRVPDLELCAAHGVDLVLAPDVPEMYPAPPCCTIEVTRLADHLCGRYRPGHFRGVATVVMKLLLIVQPDRAYFGEKDAQQLAIVRRLASDLNASWLRCSISHSVTLTGRSHREWRRSHRSLRRPARESLDIRCCDSSIWKSSTPRSSSRCLSSRRRFLSRARCGWAQRG